MKLLSAYLSTLILIASCIMCLAQSTEEKTIQLIQERNIYLNGGTRAAFGGKSRTYLKIDLPSNTKYWFYSFTTSPGESGSGNLNLLAQLTAILTDPTGLTSAAVSRLEAPSGSQSIDIYLCDRNNIDLFLQKADNYGGSFSYMLEGAAENTRQGVVRIDDVRTGTWYLGLKNPSSLDGVNITIEVVAIVEDKVERVVTEAEEQASLYGSLGWKKFEDGDYQGCIESSLKSIELFELGWVRGNLGLSYLIIGDEAKALESYTRAIIVAKQQASPKLVFEALIADLENHVESESSRASAENIIELLQSELRRL